MFEGFKNNIDFFIRNNTKFSRKNFVEKNHKIIEHQQLENLYIESILSKFFEKNLKSDLRILDIGSKNWSYANGEYSFFKSFNDDFVLDGIEIDPYRLYNNFYSRYEVAKSNIKNLKNTNYICGNLLDFNKKYDYIIWLLPFVFPEPHIFWGLPKKYFYPEKLLKHAYSLLNPGGQMLIINQGENEAKEQEILLSDCKIGFRSLGEIENSYFKHKFKRYGFLIKK